MFGSLSRIVGFDAGERLALAGADFLPHPDRELVVESHIGPLGTRTQGFGVRPDRRIEIFEECWPILRSPLRDTIQCVCSQHLQLRIDNTAVFGLARRPRDLDEIRVIALPVLKHRAPVPNLGHRAGGNPAVLLQVLLERAVLGPRIDKVQHRHVFLSNRHAAVEHSRREERTADNAQQYNRSDNSSGSFHGNVLNIRNVNCSPSAMVHIRTAINANRA